MPGTRGANYCPEGCYWPCEHRAPGAAGSSKGGWKLGPDAGDDPEELALEEWQLHSIAGIAVLPANPHPQVLLRLRRVLRGLLRALTRARAPPPTPGRPPLTPRSAPTPPPDRETRRLCRSAPPAPSPLGEGGGRGARHTSEGHGAFEGRRASSCGALRPPHPHPGRACAARGSGPPTHPRISSLWGLRPHAPTGISSAPAGSEDSGSLSLR